MPTNHRRRFPHSIAGFTLLELVLVLFLIGLLASAGLLFTQNIEDQAHFAETQRRLEIIRKAIIQGGERSVNGQPELSGFVVDNGRLPYCLAELIGPEFAFTESVSSVNHYQSPCNTNNLLELLKPGITDDGIRYGWWGPYIQVNPDNNSDRPFRDGYGNDDQSTNYGWGWTLSESQVAVEMASFDPSADTAPRPFDLTVQSSGFDINSTADDYPPALTDYLIVESDWRNASDIAIQFVNTSAVSAIENMDDQTWSMTLATSGVDSMTFNQPDFAVTPSGSSLPAGAMYQKTVSLDSEIPVGYYLINISCTPATNPCPSIRSTPFTITILPRQQIAPIRWNLSP
ncbi:MAG: prepilin-type N-terminal cleavage/methylation domain-containing protein [Methylophaga sp.]